MAGYNSAFTGPQIDGALSRAASGGAIDAAIQAKPNPNLLDNWCFGNPVNQRGKTEYINTGNYCIDRWISGADTAKLESDGLLITAPSSGIVFRQVIEKPERLSGKTVTLSIDATVISGNWNLTDVGNFSAQHTDYHINNGVTSWTFQVNSPSNFGDAVSVGFWGDSENAQIKVRSIKLELGSQQTLAHQDADGNWMLNEIPDYGEQLARCQRYYRRLYFSYLKFAHYASGVARVGIPINGMRTKPSCNIIGTPTCYAEDSWAITSLALGLNVSERTTEMEAANVDLVILEGSGAVSNKAVCNDLLVEVISDL